ncbi:MAG: Tetratricopeptide 2 repeat protein [Bryobacterales bacterium]|nr:Tetratricopeptide 2 repeat protein [Bryobacterales bacterium]
MKVKKQQAKKSGRSAVKTTAAVVEKQRTAYWPYALGFVIALALAFEVYGPSLNGPFLFDDQYLPFSVSTFPVNSLYAWVAGVRPLLMMSYWVNYQLSGLQTASYHAFNVFFHVVNSVLLFLITRKVLEFAQVERERRDALAAFAGALFLLHPVNTESVAYIASRSENLSVLWFFGAFTLFLYRRSVKITWLRSAIVLIFFGAAVLSKEHTIVLPALLLLTDYFWNPPFSLAGVRRNWKLYVPVLAGGLIVGGYTARLLKDPNIGFRIKDFTWYQYFFTQCRAFWLYIRLFIFPANLTIDYDFPISRTILDHGAILGLIAILLAAGAAFYFRRRYPLAAYGFFAFVILMAPTSSFVPIKDPVAERRLYLSMIGLLFIVLEFLRRVNVKQTKWIAGLASVLVLAAVMAHSRSAVFSDSVALWEDTVAKSPQKARDEFQLAEAYRERGDCARALDHYGRTEKLDSTDDRLYIDWGLAYDCLNQPAQALAKLQQAAKMKPGAHVYSQIGMIYGKQGRNAEALEALAMAAKLDPNFDTTYRYRGAVHANMGDLRSAVDDFRRAVALNPRDQISSQSLATAEAQLQRGQ